MIRYNMLYVHVSHRTKFGVSYMTPITDDSLMKHVISRYTFTTDKENVKPTRFVLLSDLHDREIGKNNCDLLDTIRKLSPDFVVFAGDMVTSYWQSSYDYTPTLDFIEALSKEYTIYYGIGNHERRFIEQPDRFPGRYEELTSFLAKVGVPLLHNTTSVLSEYGIVLYGFDLPLYYYRKYVTRELPLNYMNDIFGKPSTDDFSILIAHNPEHFPAFADWGCDLVLSGHIHGGIVRLPFLGGVISPQMKLFPKYDGGLFKEKETSMVLSRGIGSHTIPLRINNPAEVIEITIERG